MKRRSLPALLLAGALVAVACGGGGGAEGAPAEEGGAAAGELVAQVASYDLAVGSEARLLVGLLTPDNLFVTGGTATFRLAYLGADGSADPEPAGEVEASFLALPGEEAEHERPAAGPATRGRGVYAATVTFDRPGIWQVEAVAEVDGEPRSGTAAFQVAEAHRVPAVGDRALPTNNLTMDSDAPPGAIDSRAEIEGGVPDPELHATTIARALKAGHPVLAVFATPVYCISRFCGPITEMVEELAADYGDRADFVHVEIWRDFQGQVINRAAADWLLRDGNLNEPWVFFIGSDGIIQARWDNVATRGEIEPYLRDLPPLA